MMQKSRFQCTNCKYSFQRYAKPKICPYCAKETVVESSSQGAEDLLRESE